MRSSIPSRWCCNQILKPVTPEPLSYIPWQISAINKESMFILKTRVIAFKTYLLI